MSALALVADVGIELVVVDDVVAVLAAGSRPEVRRRIEPIDAERREVGHDRLGVREAELRTEL
jgi:hypothetical protein